jgi:hypothetical protein
MSGYLELYRACRRLLPMPCAFRVAAMTTIKQWHRRTQP